MIDEQRHKNNHPAPAKKQFAVHEADCEALEHRNPDYTRHCIVVKCLLRLLKLEKIDW